MRLFSRTTLLSGLANVSFNVSATWLAVAFITPGALSYPLEKMFNFLLATVPWGVLLFFAGLIFLERSKK